MAVMKKLRCDTCNRRHTVRDSEPDYLLCPEDDCDGVARYRHGYSIHLFVCDADQRHQFDVLNDWKAGEDPREARPCPIDGCDGQGHALVHAVGLNDWSDKSTNFPYYDRGLGEWVVSKEHRRELMRQRGLVEAGGDEQRLADDHRRKVRDQEEADDAWWDEYQDKLEHSPEFADFRKARDAGALPSLDDIAETHADLMEA